MEEATGWAMNTLRGDGFWYLATPYSRYPAGLEIAFRHACTAAGELLKHGVHVYSPIAHTHPIAVNGGLDPFSHDIFIPLDEHFMRAARGLLVLRMPGWDQSKGIDIEIEHFRRAQKPIHHLAWPVMEIVE